MTTLIKISIFVFITVLLQGCLTFNTISYEVQINPDGDGSVIVRINDIRSDSNNQMNLDEDKRNLFDFLAKSEDFLKQMKEEGKFITRRELYIEDNKLNGIIEYSFDDITNVEGIVYESPYYFLTIAPSDSILSTNGQVMVSPDYKRIIWDNSIKMLKFKMFVSDTESGNLVSMSRYFNENQ